MSTETDMLSPSLDMLGMQYRAWLREPSEYLRESAQEWLEICVRGGATCDQVCDALNGKRTGAA